MKKEHRVSIAVIKRLPKYYRYLGMIAEKGIIRISSQELSNITGLTASQIRQDLNHFGGFGQQGYGYNVEELRGEIERIIGINRDYNAVIVGAGNIGHALAQYERFEGLGFMIIGMFDTDEEKIGEEFDGIPVYDQAELSTFIDKEKVDIVVITTPAHVAQQVADIAVDAGVKGIWNFAPVDLKVPEKVVVENVHLNESLFTLTYYINNQSDYVPR
ncbi:MAG: redox-sensing transcriptional repressor Rex [Tissierellia bacterium]|jgi:redox-sensing transcriptional repressor|nr:redox-sensing transcriptional repressor Rex [Bacillota bacterium]NLK59382.1 redox-sensing transcriptional repressor Rex [Tissierellia bacterium]